MNGLTKELELGCSVHLRRAEAILILSAAVVILDTYFGTSSTLPKQVGPGMLLNLTQALNGSTTVHILRSTTVPVVLAHPWDLSCPATSRRSCRVAFRDCRCREDCRGLGRAEPRAVDASYRLPETADRPARQSLARIADGAVAPLALDELRLAELRLAAHPEPIHEPRRGNVVPVAAADLRDAGPAPRSRA